MTKKNLRLKFRSLIRICFIGLAVQIAGSGSAGAQSTQTTGSQQPPLMDQEKEIVLALSACPPSVASKAAVYVLNTAGYIKVRDSQNGFTAIVQHALPTSQEPQCMDTEGTRTHLPRILKVPELRAQGKSRDETHGNPGGLAFVANEGSPHASLSSPSARTRVQAMPRPTHAPAVHSN